MEPALWAAKTGLDAQQTQMTVTANNLANVNTNGFKKSRAVFNDLLYQNVTQVGGSTSDTTLYPSGLQLGTGAVFGVLYVATGALAACVAAHWAYNALVGARVDRRRAVGSEAL